MSRLPRSILSILFPVALAAVFAVVPGGPVPATNGQIHVVKAAVANLRAAPNTKARIIARLRRGDRVMEFGRKGQWLKVQQMGTVGPEGWLFGSLLEPEPAAPPVIAPPALPRSDAAPPRTAPPADDTVYLIPHGVLPRHRHRRPRHRPGHDLDEPKIVPPYRVPGASLRRVR
ncbi:MAG: SH3 domain-containing protein [Alphaproteobacteria bacterium]|nr:SH3 domain-containing protein [Alphaproteobacteria bacterium]